MAFAFVGETGALKLFPASSYAWDSGRTSSLSSSRVSMSLEVSLLGDFLVKGLVFGASVSPLGDFRTRGLVLGTGLGFGELGGVLMVVIEKRTFNTW